MNTADLIKKVRKIEIKTRGLSNHIFSGHYHSAFKGKGMAFSEVREYHYGDDIRSIDWNVTARFNNPYIKVFEEERELTVILLVDVSGSNDFGTIGQFKRDVITEIAAVLAFSAIQNNDKVGLIFFSDQIEKFIPPKKGSSHILRIIRELINFEAESKGTSVTEGLKYLSSVIKRHSVVFMISDFQDTGFTDSLRIAARKHDLVSIQIKDECETALPNVGLIQMQDTESGQVQWVDTSANAVRERFAAKWNKQQQQLEELFLKAGVDLTTIRTDEDYVKPLTGLFKKRSKKR